MPAPEPLLPSRALTRAEVRAVDRRAIELGVPGVVLMENAGLGLTRAALRGLAPGARVAIVAGRGNNGGDGFVLARQLALRGVEVELAFCGELDAAALRGDAGQNLRPLLAVGPFPRALPEPDQLAAWLAEVRPRCALLVDALFGTGLASPLRPEGLAQVQALDAAGLPILAVDLPSGLCCDSGQPLGAALRAERTVTFVARKRGFDAPGAERYTGAVEVVAIGCPPAAWAALEGLEPETP